MNSRVFSGSLLNVNSRKSPSAIGLVLAGGLFVFLPGCGQEFDDGLDKHPVTGLVLVDGDPAEGVVVRFFRNGESGKSNADTPLGITGSEGTFKLSTNEEGDGAVIGDYRVTFTWKTGNSPGAVDKLGGRYTSLAKSEHNATVKPGDNQLSPFNLETSEAPETSARRPSRDQRPNPNVPAARTP